MIEVESITASLTFIAAVVSRAARFVPFCLFLSASPALAVDYSLSGFGTIQYTVGDNQANYLRFANDDGTLKVNSVLGAQLDVQLTPEWGATVQYVLAPKQDNDHGTELDTRWAFVNWRPSDNLHFKLGRQRLNLYLDSENLDVGQTYVPANLGPEVYYNAGVLAIDGFSATYSLEDAAGRYWAVQAISGRRDIPQRLSNFNGDFPSNEFDFIGLVLSLDGDNYRLQLAHHQADVMRPVRQFNGLPVVNGTLEAQAYFTNVGAEYRWEDYTLRAELSQVEIATVTQGIIPLLGPQVQRAETPKFPEHGGNLTLIRALGDHLAVYVSAGRFISDFDDQHSLAIGGRHLINPSQSVKVELMRVVEKNNRPQLSDNRTPNTTFYLLSVNYNWVWQ
ncbi:MAG TPA: hypothetical protein VFV39_07405 [Limnobacter sp.]|nr:hypothetical protein [Limnobacter sp.]